MNSNSSLAYYASAWLYQGFDAESGTPAGAALKFVRSSGAAAGDFADELEGLLGDCRSDGRLAAALRDMGADYAPRAPGRLRRELTEALEVVAAWEQHAAELAHAVQSAMDAVPHQMTPPARRLLQALLQERSDHRLAASVEDLIGQQPTVEPRALRQRLEARLASRDVG